MTNFIRRQFLALTIAVLSIFATPLMAQTPHQGPIILTVSGAIENHNRGASDPDFDKFFTYNDVEFTAAAQFDFAGLSALDVVDISADFPMGGSVHSFSGPTLWSVLNAAGVDMDSNPLIIMRALDGYAIEVPLDELVDAGAVIAHSRDGNMFALGDYGPTQIVFPRAEREDLADMNDDRWIWSIFHIHVE
ncbi:MAG: hypothetical protein JKY31_10180 [Rhodobacteraceae bacterium]|nr:hypothetical protein [Paracoccaceae bacterium]